MISVETLVVQSAQGNEAAYEALVRRFQDMAVGYGYALLREFQLAEDAAQEAFLEAYRTLSQLREPVAFPGWFRRIVFKRCDRILRVRTLSTVPLESAEFVPAGFRVSTTAEETEMK